MRRFLTLFTTAILITSVFLTPLAYAQNSQPENSVPSDVWGSINVKLTGKIKELVEPLLKAQESEVKEDPLGAHLFDNLLAGENFFLTMLNSADLNQPWIALNTSITAEAWDKIIAEKVSETYGADSIYTYEEKDSMFLTKKPSLWLGSAKDALKKIIDTADGKSTDILAQNPSYKRIAEKFVDNNFLNLYVNAGKILDTAKTELADANGPEEEMIKQLLSLYEIYEAIGLSVAETNSGYHFNLTATGNDAKLAEKGVNFNPGGSFTPSLYKKFPQAKPIFYSESYNPKASWSLSKKLLSAYEEISTRNLQSQSEEVFEQMKEETGIDIDKIMSTFEKEMAFGVQYDPKSVLPYVTLMANVGENREKGVELTETLRLLITQALKDSEAPKSAYKIKHEGDITKITLNITRLDENYDGPPFPKITLTFGVTSDNLFVFSNFPGIENPEKRGGFGDDADFKAAYSSPEKQIAGLTYLNVRNVWGFMDHVLEWVESVAGPENRPPLDFYQGYYAVLQAIYGWKDLILVSEASSNEASVDGQVFIDDAKYTTYKEFISEQKSSDQDDDGVSDFDELYIYKTPVDNGDRDGDGLNDFEALKQARNPDGGKSLFKDVKENDWYADEVGETWNTGVVKGYEDQTFKPGKMVTRAEFTAMTVRAFEEDTSKYIGVDISLSKGVNPFKDVAADAWYADPIAKAFKAGWVQGKFDDKTGDMIFRPNDPITRAEAISIINRASKALKKSSEETTMKWLEAGGGLKESTLPFKDVETDKWYYDAIENTYKHEITTGKKPTEFRPLDNLTRAEAAALLSRTLNFEMKGMSEKAELNLDIMPLIPATGLF